MKLREAVGRVPATDEKKKKRNKREEARGTQCLGQRAVKSTNEAKGGWVQRVMKALKKV
jgi:hypothetical protein